MQPRSRRLSSAGFVGSQARRSSAQGADADSAIVWYGDVDEQIIRPYLHALANGVAAGLGECGIRVNSHGATASDVLFVRSIESWQRVAGRWIEHPTREQVLILVSVLVNSRPVWGIHSGTPVSDTFSSARARPELLHLLARFALSHRPPTGFLRSLVVEHNGEHRGRLDLDDAPGRGSRPLGWDGGGRDERVEQLERLRAAGEEGTLPAADVHTLRDALALFTELRMEHQVQQLRSGIEPDDHLNPHDLSGLTRSHLKEGFRAVASVQRTRRRRTEPRRSMRFRRHVLGPGAGAYKRTRLAPGRTPWRAASYCAVDLELSGLDPKRHEIVSFGAVPIDDGRVQLSAAVRGGSVRCAGSSETSIRIHGMRTADLADAPLLDIAIDPLFAVMAGRVPVVHVAAIERGFLRPALRRQGLRLRGPMIDTSVLGRIWLHERGLDHGHVSLTDLAVALGLPSHHPHDALGDAVTTAQAFVALATHLNARRAETVRSLVSARRLESLRPYPSR